MAVRGVAADAVSVADRGDGSYKVGRGLDSCSGHNSYCFLSQTLGQVSSCSPNIDMTGIQVLLNANLY